MPILKNARHEKFAQNLVKGMGQSDAYERAGYERDAGAASRLSSDVNVSARVRDLTEEAAAAASLTKEWVLTRLQVIAERAMQEVEVKNSQGVGTGEFKFDGQAGNRALELIGKELGMFIDRAEITQTVHDVSEKPLTAEQWRAQFQADGEDKHATEH